MQRSRLERAPGGDHQRLGDLRRQQLLHPAADHLLPRVREEVGVAGEVDVHAVRGDPEHQVGDGVEERAHPRLDIRLDKWRIASILASVPGRSAELGSEVDEGPHIVVGGAEVHEARTQADLAVDRRGRHPDPAVILQPRTSSSFSSLRSPGADVTERTIESGGGPQRGSRDDSKNEVVEQAGLAEISRPPRETPARRGRGTRARASGPGTVASTPG